MLKYLSKVTAIINNCHFKKKFKSFRNSFLFFIWIFWMNRGVKESEKIDNECFDFLSEIFDAYLRSVVFSAKYIEEVIMDCVW